MSLVVVGGAVSALVGLYMCTRRSSEPYTPDPDSSVLHVANAQQLSQAFNKGGKCVVYLTASW
jgi:hypothetical protein